MWWTLIICGSRQIETNRQLLRTSIRSRSEYQAMRLALCNKNDTLNQFCQSHWTWGGMSDYFRDWFNSILSLNTFQNIFCFKFDKNIFLYLIMIAKEKNPTNLTLLGEHRISTMSKTLGRSLAMKTKHWSQHYLLHCAHNFSRSVLMLRNKQGGTDLNLNYEQMDLQIANVKQLKAALDAFFRF